VSVDEEEAYDPLRDGPLRYCGYANEVGEAFGAWLPVGGVPASYAVAIVYVLVDTYDKANAARRKAQRLRKGGAAAVAEREGVSVDTLIMLLSTERAVDTLVWQLLASVAIPGFTIHQVVYFMHLALVTSVHINDVDAMPAALAGAVAALATSLGQHPEVVRCATLCRLACWVSFLLENLAWTCPGT
jgi:fission process protein 1